MPNLDFVNLHGHSSYSIGDAVGYPENIVDYVLSNDMNSTAITDHGNMNSLADFYLYTKSINKGGNKFKPIYGIEAYFHPDLDQWKIDLEESKNLKKKSKDQESTQLMENEDESKNYSSRSNPHNPRRRHHLILLAQNETGLQNLYKLVYKANKDGYYYFPRIDFNDLKKHNEGLVATSACVAGHPNWIVLNNQEKGEDFIMHELENMYDRYVDIFGKDRYFLELQFNSLDVQHVTNQHFMKFAKKTGANLVSTADFHYFSPDVWKAREVLKQCSWAHNKDFDLNKMNKEELKCLLYPKNAEQMWDDYKKYGQGYDFYDDEVIARSINNSSLIARELINHTTPDTSPKLTQISIDGFNTPFHKLLVLCKEAMVEKNLQEDKIYIDRLKKELLMIKEKDIENYFLAMKEMMDLANEHMIVGSARGSAAGSLVCYLLKITQVDPIKYNLLFERFLNEGRMAEEWPDIDVDVEDRDQLIELFYEKYGKDAVFPISTKMRLQISSLIKDVCKLMNVDFATANMYSKKIRREIETSRNLVDDKNHFYANLLYENIFHKSKTLREFTEKYPAVKDVLPYLYMQVRQYGTHAGGVIIYNGFASKLPTTIVKGSVQTAFGEGVYDKNLPKMGGIKFDVLGLRTLRMIRKTIKYILRDHDVRDDSGRRLNWKEYKDQRWFYDKFIHPDNLDFSDRKVYENVWHEGNFLSVFQFTESGARNFSMNAKPDSIKEIAALTAIYRPGPLSSKVDKLWINAKRNANSIVYGHPIIEKLLKPTLGFPIFQESVMTLGRELGNMDWKDTDKMRKTLLIKDKSVGMDKLLAEKNALYEKFMNGANNNNYSPEKAHKLWKKLEAFSGYAFNENHALSYSLISYQCAWLLTYYPIEWCAGVLDCNPSPRNVQEVENMNVEVLDVDINESGYDWEISTGRNSVRRSILNVKGVGTKVISKIISNRPYIDFIEDVYLSGVVNKRALINLIKIDAIKSTNFYDQFKSRKQAIEIFSNEPKKNLKTKEQILELAEQYDDEEFTRNEEIENYSDIIEYVPNFLLFTPLEEKFLRENKIESLDGWQDEQIPIWFTVENTSQRKTKNNSPYVTVLAKGDSDNTWFKIWNCDLSRKPINKNQAYIAFLKKDDYGFSTYKQSFPMSVQEFIKAVG